MDYQNYCKYFSCFKLFPVALKKHKYIDINWMKCDKFCNFRRELETDLNRKYIFIAFHSISIILVIMEIWNLSVVSNKTGIQFLIETKHLSYFLIKILNYIFFILIQQYITSISNFMILFYLVCSTFIFAERYHHQKESPEVALTLDILNQMQNWES